MNIESATKARRQTEQQIETSKSTHTEIVPQNVEGGRVRRGRGRGRGRGKESERERERERERESEKRDWIGTT